jgi:hypothetical protein
MGGPTLKGLDALSGCYTLHMVLLAGIRIRIDGSGYQAISFVMVQEKHPYMLSHSAGGDGLAV